MPEIFRQPFRMDCPGGLDLVSPIDRMPPGSFPYLINVRVLEEGRLESRPGYSPFATLGAGDFPNSIRRLNDPDLSHVRSGSLYLAGGGTKLYSGQSGALNSIDSGYSGSPLSMLPFRPDQSPESWMYIYDSLKSTKVQADSTLRPIGVVPPPTAPSTEYGPPAMAVILEGQDLTEGGSGYGFSGNISSLTKNNREGTAVTSSISAIKYNSGSTGWACMVPASASPLTWAGARMRVQLNNGGGNQETVLVREIHPAISTTTIQGIAYDSGTTGGCSIVLAGSPEGIARNSLITIGGELIRVLSVNFSPDGSTYSIRCSTANTHAASDAVTGNLSWYIYTVQTHAAAENITSACIYAHGSSLGSAKSVTNSIYTIGGINAASASSRPLDLANDWCHISLWITNAPALLSLQLILDIDPNTTGIGNAFKNNYLIANLSPAQIFGAVIPQGGAWYEVLVPLAQFSRAGNDPTRTLANITATQIKWTANAVTDLAFDWWYLWGTYGPEVIQNSPTGLLYQSRFRDSSTGAASVPGPQTRHELFPIREEILVTPPTTTATGVDSIDIYRQGGTLSNFTYDGTVVNNNGSPQVFADVLPDTSLSASPIADITLLQPWVVLGLPISGTANVVGTSVTLTSGSVPLNLVANSVVLLGGIAFQIRGAPRDSTHFEIFLSAGVQSTTFLIASPQLAGTNLPFAFGPLEGPFAPVAFALGDPLNSGTLYWTNFSNLDAMADTNTLELSGPSEPLISGATYNGLVIVGSRDNIYLIRFSYLTQIENSATGTNVFQWSKIPSPSGMWSRWTCCTTPYGVAFLGRDGIYLATEQGAVNITDPKLYPIFPHDGQPGTSVNNGSNIILPVDMTGGSQGLKGLRLNYLDGDLMFSYMDTGGNSVALRFEMSRKRWFLHSYGDQIWSQYLIESDLTGPNPFEILLLSRDSPAIYLGGGNSDNGTPIESIVLTPSDDGKDERSQKLYIDAIVQADGTGPLSVAAAYDNAQSFSPVQTVICAGSIQQTILNLSSLAGTNLALYRNISAKFAWTGGPDGPRIIAWEPSGYLQPYLSKFLLTQFFGLSFPGWKHTRRLFPGMISNSTVNFKIYLQDGRSFGPFPIASTSGRFRCVPQMLPQNIKDLQFSFELDGQGQSFALFPDEFTLELKEWREQSYIPLAIWKA